MNSDEITCYSCGLIVEYKGMMDAIRCPECLEWTWTRHYPVVDSVPPPSDADEDQG